MKLDVPDALAELQPLVSAGKLMVFVGSGISVPSGLPTWEGILQEFITFCRDFQDVLKPGNRFVELLDEAHLFAAKSPTEIASVLRREVNNLQKSGLFTNADSQFKNEFQRIFQRGTPNDNHKIIVGTNYPFILTTNYDNLLQDAAKSEGYKELWKNWYTHNQADKVAAAIYLEQPSIIHLHGHVTDIALNDFVFTAEDYVRIAKKYPGFTLAIQALFMRYSVLFVGYGGTDPHLEDFMKELAFVFGWPRFPDFPIRYFITLPENEVGRITEKYNEALRKDIIVVKDYPEVTTLLEGLRTMAPRPK